MKGKRNFMNRKHTVKRKSSRAVKAFLGGGVWFFVAAAIAFSPVAMAQTSGVLPGAPGSFSKLVKRARPSVVNISTVKTIKGGGAPFPFHGPFKQNDPLKDFFDRFFKDQLPKDFKQKSLGSGFIIDEKGYILTNNHVVEKTDEIKVKLADDREYKAKIVGKDPKTDLALIRIKADGPLTPLPLGDSDKLEVGDWVVAIGNPFGLGSTVTAGIVSAKYRHIGTSSYDNFIQTDASINPGNSGGPLLNTAGEVIGINSAIFSQTGGSIGIGFAIPINMARDLLPQLKKGKVVRGWLGVMIQHITPALREKLGLKSDRGALVADVTSGGPAEKAGIRRGDVIISFDGKRIREMNDLPYLVASTPIHKKVKVIVVRAGREKTFFVKIRRMKEEERKVAAAEEKASLGMTVEELNPRLAKELGLKEKHGLVIVKVETGSPAAEAGLKVGDLILEVDREPLRNLRAFKRKMQKYGKGETILLLVKRGGSTLYLTVRAGE
jgi:serine protease Do